VAQTSEDRARRQSSMFHSHEEEQHDGQRDILLSRDRESTGVIADVMTRDFSR